MLFRTPKARVYRSNCPEAIHSDFDETFRGQFIGLTHNIFKPPLIRPGLDGCVATTRMGSMAAPAGTLAVYVAIPILFVTKVVVELPVIDDALPDVELMLDPVLIELPIELLAEFAALLVELVLIELVLIDVDEPDFIVELMDTCAPATGPLGL